MEEKGIHRLAKSLLLKLKGSSRARITIAVIAAVVVLAGAGIGGYLLYEHYHSGQSNEVTAEAVLDTETTEPTELTETLEDLYFDTEIPETETIEETEEVTEEVTEETETAEVELIELSLVGTSIERDLKVKILDQNGNLVTGEQFSISVKPDKEGAAASKYTDKDMDGILYIVDYTAGDYIVELSEIEGYEIKEGSIKVTVKGKIEYEAVDVEAEIKTENQVNTSVEDTATNNVPVESVLKDTVPLIQSTAKATTVKKTEVDTSAFPQSFISADNLSVTLEKETDAGAGDSTEEPGTTETQKPGTTETQKPGTTETQLPETATTETQLPGTTESQQPGTTEMSTQTAMATTGTEIVSAFIRRNAISRVGTANGVITEIQNGTETKTGTELAENILGQAKVSMPKKITLYNGDVAASNSYSIKLVIEDSNTIIKNITWKSLDTTIVTLSATTGTEVTVKAGKTGTANIEVKIEYLSDDEGNTAVATMQNVVNVSDFTDGTTQLQDKAGNLLYLDERAQKPATQKDYSTADKFYTSPLYTGWQTLNGKVYYYTADNKPVTGDQVIGGMKYKFNSDGSLSQNSGARGIDVSKWQGKIDWEAVAASGIDFAIIRVGYRGSSTGALIEDPYFKTNIAGATKAGIKVGVYFFTQAITEAEAVEEASMALSLVSGYKLTYPIFIDTEEASGGRANGLDKATRTAVVKAFCRTIQNAGRKAGVYASGSWYKTKLNASELNNYFIWVAQYNTTCTYTGKYDMWQYSSKGSVSGIKGNVDMNISYVKY